MKIYKIPERQIPEFAKRKNKMISVSMVIIMTILLFGIIAIAMSETITKKETLIAIVLFIATLLLFMFKSVKKMTYVFGKYQYVLLEVDQVVVGFDGALEKEFNLLQKYFYYRGNFYSAFCDRVLDVNSVKTVKETKNGLQVRVKKGLLSDVIFIPKEIGNINEIKQEIEMFIKKNNF